MVRPIGAKSSKAATALRPAEPLLNSCMCSLTMLMHMTITRTHAARQVPFVRRFSARFLRRAPARGTLSGVKNASKLS